MFNKLYILALFLISLFGVKALFHSGFYTSHDGRHQIIRLMHFHQGLVDGQLPVRWAGTALSGYGYPLFIFTYRLPFWLAEVFYLISHNLGNAIKFVFVISFLASSVTMYLFAKEVWRSRLAAFLSAVFYLWAPYRFLNIFVRAALGEAVTFMFIPLVFLGFLKLAQNTKKQFYWLIITSFSLVGIILSHLMTLGLWLIPLLLWLGLNFFQSRTKKQYLLGVFCSGLISFLLTAYYVLPAVLERRNIKFESLIGNYYQAHFVTLKQLIYSPWGYGFSFPGTESDMMSFQVGLAQWLIIFISASLLIIFILKRFLTNKKVKLNINAIYFLAIFSLSIYLMLPASEWFYQIINKYFTIDIPWRFLGVSVFSSSILFGFSVVAIKKKIFKIGLIFLSLFLCFYGNRNHLKVNQYINLPDSEYWQSTETSNEYDDYAPRWFTGSKFDRLDPDLVILKGRSQNKLLIRKSNLFRFSSDIETVQAEIAVKLAYYPGWNTFIDGKKVSTSFKDDGRITVVLDKGSHLTTFRFRETKLRCVANWISLASLILIISLVVRHAKKKNK